MRREAAWQLWGRNRSVGLAKLIFRIGHKQFTQGSREAASKITELASRLGIPA
jgi:hypothetical protein